MRRKPKYNLVKPRWRWAAPLVLTSCWLISSCLQHSHPSTPKIYGGTPVAPGDLPAVVALTLQLPGGGARLSCSGVLIAADVILTAGHCLKGPGFDATTLGEQLKEQLRVYFGDGAEGGELSAGASVQAVAVHPLLRLHPIGYADYGLVFLSAPITGIPPLPVLVSLAQSLHALRAGSTTLVGYGERDDRGSGRKFQVDAVIHSFNSAEAQVGGGGKDACGGDSGGPALVKGDEGAWQLLGTVSRGIHLGCGDGGLISLAADGWCWVQQAAAGHLQGPTADCALWYDEKVKAPRRADDFLQLCQSEYARATQQETIQAIMLSLATTSCTNAAQRLKANPQLNLDGLMLRDLTPLALLHNLSSLSLKGNRLSDLSPLRALTGLKLLEIDGNQVTSTAPLAALEQQGLRILGTRRQLGNNQDTAFFRLCQEQTISAGALATIKSIFYKTQSSDCATANQRLLSLTQLTLNDRQISDVTPLAGLQQLTVLDLSGNTQLVDGGPLSGLERLKTLNLAGTKVTDLSPLAGLKANGLVIIGP